MITTRIAAIVLFVLALSNTLTAQAARTVQVKIKVTDQSAEAISGALIQIDASGGTSKVETVANDRGEALVDIQPGHHALSIKARIFKPYASQIDSIGTPGQVIYAVMDVDCDRSICDIIVTADGDEPTVQHASMSVAPLTQANALVKLTVVVKDQTGAVIPGARILATDSRTGSRINAMTGPTGQTVVPLNQGIYDLTVQALGFQVWEENKLEANGEMLRDVTLAISNSGCGPCVVPDVREIPLEREPFATEIPLIPTQGYPPPSRRLHRHFHSL